MIKRIILLLALVSVSILAYPIASKALKKENKILDIQTVQTQSGIKAWFVKDPTLPIISIDFAFKGSGSIQDPDDKQGLAQLLSNTLDEGAGPYDSATFQKLLNDNSIELSFSQSRDYFSGHIKTLERNKDLALELMSLALSKPRFEQDALDRMRNANLTRIRSSMSQPGWMMARIYNDRVFQDHPYARNSGGTLSSLPQITSDDLRGFVKDNFVKDRLYIGVVGDFEASELSGILDQLFGHLPQGKALAPITDSVIDDDTSVILYEQAIPQTLIRRSWNGISQKDPDYYSAMVMNYIFGGAGFGSRLMTEVREKRGLSYGIYSQLSHMEHANTLTISTSTNNETVDEVLNIIDEEVEKMIKTPVNEADLQAAKDFLTGSLPLSLTSTDKVSALLLNMQVDELPIDYLDQRNSYIRKVTADQVNAVAKRLLGASSYMTFLVGQPKTDLETDIMKDLPNVE